MITDDMKKIFGIIFFAIFTIVVSIWTVVIPFVYKYPLNVWSYTIITVIALLMILAVNLCGNTALIIACLHRYSTFKDTYTYMFIYVGLADILFCIIAATFIIMFQLLHLTTSFLNIDLAALHIAFKCSVCIRNGLEAISIIGFTGYVAMNLLKVHSVCQTLLRRMTEIFSSLIFLYGVLVAVLNYVFFDEEWQHLLLSFANLFFPLFIWIMLMVLSFQLNRFRTRVSQISNVVSIRTLYIIGGAYLVLNAPFYITYMLHKYCCRIDWEESLKVGHITICLRLVNTITTPLLLFLFENRFRDSIYRLLSKNVEGNQYVVSFNQGTERAHILERTDDEEPLVNESV